MITWITEKVAIGDYKDSSNVGLLVREKIDCILDLRRFHSDDITICIKEETEDLCGKEGCFPHFYHIEVGSCKGIEPVKIELRTAAYMLEKLVEKYKRILVHCTAGIDRAPFVVAYWMIGNYWIFDDISYLEGKDLRNWMDKSYEFIKKKRPQIREHLEWV